jgi:hypothetical protein
VAHHYKAKDGRILPSVTKVIGDITGDDYRYWYSSLRKKGYDPEQVLKDMGNIGTICHYRVLSKLSPSPIEMPDIPISEYPEGVESYAEIFEMLWEQTGLSFRKATVERFEVDEDLGYCGTRDINGEVYGEVKDERTGETITFKGTQTIGDLKTSKEAKEKHFLQLGAYYPFVNPVPQWGLVMCLCPYTRADTPYGNKNKNLLPKVYVLTREELMLYRDKFYVMLKEWWKRHDSR